MTFPEERLTSVLFLVTPSLVVVERELMLVPFVDERETLPSRVDIEREFSPSRREALRALLLCNDEFRLSTTEELRPGEVAGRVPTDLLLFSYRLFDAREMPVALRPYWLR